MKTKKQKKLIKTKTYRLATNRQKSLLNYYKQRKFLNSLIDYAQNKKVENMFKMITNIKMDGNGGKYSVKYYSLMPDIGYKRKGKMFTKTEKFNRYEKDIIYRNKLNKEIIKNERKYMDYFLSNSSIYKNFYTKKIRDYLIKEEFDNRLINLDSSLSDTERLFNIKLITNDTKIKHIQSNFGFIIQELTADNSVLVINKIITADKVFDLLRYLRDTNVLVDKASISKVKKTINSKMFKVKCQITIKNKG